MPHADLPTTPLGWLAAIGAGLVGFMAGFYFLALLTRMTG